MKSIAVVLTLASVLATPLAHAQSAEDLMKAKGCLGCHDFDKKKVGPAFKDVNAKYKGNADAKKMLVAKIKEGKGHLKINASEAEIGTMVDRVLK